MDDFDAKVVKAVKAEMVKACRRVKSDKVKEDLNAFENLNMSDRFQFPQ
jgi:hypothetical protein